VSIFKKLFWQNSVLRETTVENTSESPYLVTKALLDLHDKYDGDFGLLFEPWASKEDRAAFTDEQMSTLYYYLDRLRFAKVDCLSPELRLQVENRVKELEQHIDPEVLTILRERNAKP
jgi:hypothetical protein